MYQQFPNIGYFLSRLDQDVLKPLIQEVSLIQNNFDSAKKNNLNLAGHIEKEYQIIESKKLLESIILPLIVQYNKESEILKQTNVMSEDLPLYLDTAWVNFQKKYEYNPLHDHEGILSFVLWLSIPYNIEAELTQGMGRFSNSNHAAHFELVYTNSLGQVAAVRLPVDKTYENSILIFPSKMSHCVYPFVTSDDYRISVSGNFKLLVRY